MQKNLLLPMAMILTASMFASGAANHPGLTLAADSVVDATGLNFVTGEFGTCINGQTFQQESVVSFNGYQYAAYFAVSKRPAVARRALPDGAWETIVFDDYGPIAHTDVHDVNVIGICPEDGTIHLAFDHHVHPLHYRRSVANVATKPREFAWKQSLFGATTSALETDKPLDKVTYPQFFTTPQNRLQLALREGSSGAGDWHLYEYRLCGACTAVEGCDDGPGVVHPSAAEVVAICITEIVIA